MKFSWSHIKNTLAQALLRGTSPQKLAVTCALGITFGLFPVWGTTTIVCFGVAAAFRLNVVVLQLVNYAISPIQILLMLPFIKGGSMLFGLDPFPYSTEEFVLLLKSDFWRIIKETATALGAGVALWLLISPLLFGGVYLLSLAGFTKWSRRNQREL